MKKALTAREDTNMYGGAHVTNVDTARKAAREGRDLVIHANHHDGQRAETWTYRVTNLRELPDGRVIGTRTDREEWDWDGAEWEATYALCEYAKTGEI